jgi:hypothetical protein
VSCDWCLEFQTVHMPCTGSCLLARLLAAACRVWELFGALHNTCLQNGGRAIGSCREGGKAARCGAKQRMLVQGRAGQGRARQQGRARKGKTGQGMATGQGRPGYHLLTSNKAMWSRDCAQAAAETACLKLPLHQQTPEDSYTPSYCRPPCFGHTMLMCFSLKQLCWWCA